MKKQNNKKNTLEKINHNAAGIDIGASEHYVAVPAGRDKHGQDVRSFSTFTTDLYNLAAWLKECRIDTIAMESTGVYWIPVFEILETKGFDVRLVNPRQIKNAPGRKTDVVDSRWIQQLHSYGLLQSAFRPEEQICVLRSYLRQRAMLTKYASQHIQHMQKALEQMNIKLSRVINDITGVTGMRIIQAIVNGENDPVKLARFRSPNCKNGSEVIAESLNGNWRQEHIFALSQALHLYKTYCHQIKSCDEMIHAHISEFDDKDPHNVVPPGKKKNKKNKNAFNFDAHTHLYRITGVDLTGIDGVEANTALQIIGEIGLDMSRWPSEKHFCSWLSLCPGNKISGGKRISTRSKPSANRAAHLFRMCAYSLHNSRSHIGAFLRRKKAQLGSPKAITATAHKIARIFYSMLKHGSEYIDLGKNYYEDRYKKRVINNLKRKAKDLGYTLIETVANETSDICET